MAERGDGKGAGARNGKPVDGYRALAAVQLRKLAGFDAVEPALVAGWVDGGRLVRARRGEVIRQRGDSCDGLLLVVDGAVAVGRDLGLPNAHLFSLLGPGDVHGLASLFDGRTLMHDLVAHEPSVLLLIHAASVRAAQSSHAALREALILQLAHRSRLLYDRLFEQVSLPLSARLARQLDALGKCFGTPRPGGLLISVRLAQADLARMLGASRQQVNAELKRFAERGLIHWSNSRVLIRDPQALETSGAGKLPITLRQAEPPASAAPAAPPTPATARLRGLRVLLVDDDAVTRLVVAAQFAREGAQVEEAEHGAAAVAAVRSARRRYDLIVMDEQMPVQGGADATRDIRSFQADAGQPATPVLGVSSAASRNDRRRYFAAGMSAHLAKPFTSTELLDTVLQLLAARR